jgi:SAM-dependent methyltransferase
MTLLKTNIKPQSERQVDYNRYHYRKWHRDDADHIEGMKVYYKSLLREHLPDSKQSRILDIGCGMGFTLLALKDLGYHDIAGVDVDQGQVESCRNKGLPVEYVVNTYEYLSEKHEKFDCVLLLDVLEHVACDRQLDLAGAIYSSLKPGGRLICTVPNASSSLGCRWRYNDWTHYSSFTEVSIEFVLANVGFEIQTIKPVEFFSKPKGIWYMTPRVFRAWLWKNLFQWVLLRIARSWRRLECIGELGWDQGMKIPLSLNLIVVAAKHENI